MPDFNLSPAGLNAGSEAFLRVQDLDAPPTDAVAGAVKKSPQPVSSEVRPGLAGTRATKVPLQLGRSDPGPQSAHAKDLAGAKPAGFPLSGKLTLEAFGNSNGVGASLVGEAVVPISANGKVVIQGRQRWLDSNVSGQSASTRLRVMYQHSFKNDKTELVLGAGGFASTTYTENGPASVSYGLRATANLTHKPSKAWLVGVKVDGEFGPKVVRNEATTTSGYLEVEGYVQHSINPKNSVRAGVAGFNRFQRGENPNAVAAYVGYERDLGDGFSLATRISATLKGTRGTSPDSMWGPNPGSVSLGVFFNKRF